MRHPVDKVIARNTLKPKLKAQPAETLHVAASGDGRDRAAAVAQMEIFKKARPLELAAERKFKGKRVRLTGGRTGVVRYVNHCVAVIDLDNGGRTSAPFRKLEVL